MMPPDARFVGKNQRRSPREQGPASATGACAEEGFEFFAETPAIGTSVTRGAASARRAQRRALPTQPPTQGEQAHYEES